MLRQPMMRAHLTSCCEYGAWRLREVQHSYEEMARGPYREKALGPIGRFSYARRRQMNKRRETLRCLASCCMWMVFACSGKELSTTAPSSTVDRRYVTGEAAAALDASGRFILRSAAVADGSEISEARAIQLVSAYVRDFGEPARPQYEADRGEPIDLSNLGPCPRAYYASSAYDQTSLPVSEYGKRVLGSWWLVSLCRSDGAPIISVAVSARATDLQLDPVDQHLSNPGDNFVSSGVPVGLLSVPSAPEGVAEIVATSTKQRVSKVPELVLPIRPFAPQLARWHVTVEAPIDLRGMKNDERVQRTDLYYGFEDTWRASSLQIGSASNGTTEPFRDIQNRHSVVVSVSRRADSPHGFEPATVVTP
jgi:hypothetical protein